MPISIQCQRVVTPVNRTVSFVFDGVVEGYLAGISYFELTYGAADYWVTGLQLSLQHTQVNAQIDVAVNARMWDNSGHELSGFFSKVTVVVMAWTAPSSEVVIQEVLKLPTGGEGPGSGVQLTFTSVQAEAILSGFDIEYSTDYWVGKVMASAGTSITPSTGWVTSQAAMNDHSGHNATTATIDGWLIAADAANPGFLVQPIPSQQTQSHYPVDFTPLLRQGQMLIGGAVLLTGFEVQYPGADFWLKTIGAGAEDWSISGSAITLTGARAFMWDNKNHSQDDGNSNASLIAIGVVGTDPAKSR